MTNKSADKTVQQIDAKQLAIEVGLLRAFDPNDELIKEFETASLHDFQENELAS